MLPTYDQYVGNIVMLCWQHIRIKSGLNFSHKDIESFASPLEAITLNPLVFNVSEIISLNILWSSITIILYKTETP